MLREIASCEFLFVSAKSLQTRLTLCNAFCSLQEVIGSGQFGKVQRGVWKSQSEGEVDVAVKTLNKGAEKVKFLQEAAIMGQFQHPSIVKLHGVVIIGEPVSWQCTSHWHF